ncbi:MAG: TetR/AcrR family transcriptional regulator [Bacillota bacterium]|nr:TetR/AcrR family transcriptional regulator [Bacillota bacterium]
MPNDIARKLQVSLSFQERYARASTNTIVREAGISKGLLFRHFGSKKDLHLAALDHCLEVQVGYFKEPRLPYPPYIIERVIEGGPSGRAPRATSFTRGCSCGASARAVCQGARSVMLTRSHWWSMMGAVHRPFLLSRAGTVRCHGAREGLGGWCGGGNVSEGGYVDTATCFGPG